MKNEDKAKIIVADLLSTFTWFATGYVLLTPLLQGMLFTSIGMCLDRIDEGIETDKENERLDREREEYRQHQVSQKNPSDMDKEIWRRRQIEGGH